MGSFKLIWRDGDNQKIVRGSGLTRITNSVGSTEFFVFHGDKSDITMSLNSDFKVI